MVMLSGETIHMMLNESTDRLVSAQDDIRILRSKLADLDWKPITETSLPKIGDELWGPRAGLMKLPEGYAPMIPMMEDFTFAGWTHFRPINAPTQQQGKR